MNCLDFHPIALKVSFSSSVRPKYPEPLLKCVHAIRWKKIQKCLTGHYISLIYLCRWTSDSTLLFEKLEYENMLKPKNWIADALWKPKKTHSLEQLRYLHYILQRNSTVTESNKGLLVETLRSIAEILIWGDQNDSTVFE